MDRGYNAAPEPTYVAYHGDPFGPPTVDTAAEPTIQWNYAASRPAAPTAPPDRLHAPMIDDTSPTQKKWFMPAVSVGALSILCLGFGLMGRVETVHADAQPAVVQIAPATDSQPLVLPPAGTTTAYDPGTPIVADPAGMGAYAPPPSPTIAVAPPAAPPVVQVNQAPAAPVEMAAVPEAAPVTAPATVQLPAPPASPEGMPVPETAPAAAPQAVPAEDVPPSPQLYATPAPDTERVTGVTTIPSAVSLVRR